MFATPMHLPPRDFSTELLQCRWQALPARAETMALADEWLDTLAGGQVGLHRDHSGRPRLAEGKGDIGWSHSGGRLLMAHSPAGRVGVDIEATTRTSNAMAIAWRYFDPGEAETLAKFDQTCRQLAFLRLWCAKEAVLKAAGLGIAFGLHRVAFDVSGQAPRIIKCDPALGDIDAWTIHQLEPEPGFIAVLASTP